MVSTGVQVQRAERGYKDVLRWQAWREVGYTIKVPFYHWLDLRQFIRKAPT